MEFELNETFNDINLECRNIIMDFYDRAIVFLQG